MLILKFLFTLAMVTISVNGEGHTLNTLSAPCGLSGSLIDRIQNCNSFKGHFALLTRTQSLKEIYVDLSDGVVWGERLPGVMNQLSAEHACSTELAEVPELRGLRWELPRIGVFEKALKKGIQHAIPSMAQEDLWSSSVIPENTNYAWVFSIPRGDHIGTRSKDNKSARCIAKLRP